MTAATGLETIRQIFDRRFAQWGITLPAEHPDKNQRGAIAQNGWTIHYRFGAAEGLDYLEFFASHRMTNDTLNRIHADGREELLGFCQEFHAAGSTEAERAYYEHNRKFYEDVKRRGLL